MMVVIEIRFGNDSDFVRHTLQIDIVKSGLLNQRTCSIDLLIFPIAAFCRDPMGKIDKHKLNIRVLPAYIQNIPALLDHF